jgi:hypothetical protein
MATATKSVTISSISVAWFCGPADSAVACGRGCQPPGASLDSGPAHNGRAEKPAAFYPYAASNVDDSRTIVRPAFLPVSRTTTVTFFSGRPLLLAGHEGLAADPVGLAPGQVHAT